jgi:hypothetical protein
LAALRAANDGTWLPGRQEFCFRVDNCSKYRRIGYRELVTRNVDIILASGPEIALKSALATSTTIPIVMIAVDYDPLARGRSDSENAAISPSRSAERQENRCL